jgi:hypothetical protein
MNLFKALYPSFSYTFFEIISQLTKNAIKTLAFLVADPEGDLEVRTPTSFVIFCSDKGGNRNFRVEPSFDVVKGVTETSSFTCDITEKSILQKTNLEDMENVINWKLTIVTSVENFYYYLSNL